MKGGWASDVRDVAAHIMLRTGDLSEEKLHILLYFCQVWSFQWEQRRFFNAKIAASSEGPRIEGIDRDVAKRRGRSAKLSARARAAIDQILNFYGNKHLDRLTALALAEQPFRAAWLSKTAGGDGAIDDESIAAFVTARSDGRARTARDQSSNAILSD